MRGLDVGGIELRLIDLTRELNHTGDFDCEIVTIMEKGALFTEAGRQGMRVQYIPVPHRTNIKGLCALRAYIREGNFDIVHTHSFYPNVPGRIAALFACTPVIIAHQHSLYSRKCKRKKHRWYEKILAPFTDTIIAVSQSVKEDYVGYTGVSESRVRVIHNGVDLSPFKNVSYDTRTLRQELGLEGKTVVGSVGRLVWVKGYPFLIQAARKVVEHRDDVVFVIAGDGTRQYRQKLLQQIEKLDLREHVRLVGYREDVPALMQMFDIGALPSRFEGFPGVLVEFLASATPVVATNTGGQTEIVTHEKNALIVPPGEPDALAHSLLRLINDTALRETLASHGESTAEEFSLETMMHNFDSLYKEQLRKQ